MINLAESIKAYFSVIHDVALMCNHIHPACVAEELELLTEPSEPATSEARISSYHSLADHGRTLSTEHAGYVARV